MGTVGKPPWRVGRSNEAYSCPQVPDAYKLHNAEYGLLWAIMGTVGSGLNSQRPSCRKLHSLCSNIYVTKVRKLKK